MRPVEKEEVRARDSDPGLFVDLNHEDYYFPSVDLLTAQVHAPKDLTFSYLKHVVSVNTPALFCDSTNIP